VEAEGKHKYKHAAWPNNGQNSTIQYLNPQAIN